MPTVKGHQRFSHKYLVLQIFSENWANRTDPTFHDKWKYLHQNFMASLIVGGNGLLSAFPAMRKSQQLLSYFHYSISCLQVKPLDFWHICYKITKHWLAVRQTLWGPLSPIVTVVAAAGLVAMGGPETLLSSSTALSAFQVPVINVKPDFYSDLGLGGTSNVLTTAPDLGAQARVGKNHKFWSEANLGVF